MEESETQMVRATLEPAAAGGGAGGGAGGSILIKTMQSPILGSNLVTATGGAGGPPNNSAGAGGPGGNGRIRVEQIGAIPVVTTNPAASTASFTSMFFPSETFEPS